MNKYVNCNVFKGYFYWFLNTFQYNQSITVLRTGPGYVGEVWLRFELSLLLMQSSTWPFLLLYWYFLQLILCFYAPSNNPDWHLSMRIRAAFFNAVPDPKHSLYLRIAANDSRFKKVLRQANSPEARFLMYQTLEFGISLHGSSCNYLFFSLILAPLLSPSIS